MRISDWSSDVCSSDLDRLEADGKSLAKLGNLERKERLEALLRDAKAPVAVADHVIGAGEKLYAAMCGAGQEGIISKRADAAYAGRRTKSWVKVKCTRSEEHTSELQSLMRISYAVFCLKKKKNNT